MRKLNYRIFAALILSAATVMLSSCGNAGTPAEVNMAAEAVKETTGKVASASDMAEVEEVVDDTMEPVEGSKINNGVYEVKVDSSSSMFTIESCSLTVENGKMTAEMQMSGSGYRYLYLGTAEEAAAADESDFIESEDNAEGKNVFNVEVEALDKGIDCAAFSKKKEQWYPRTIVFRADSLPFEAFREARGNTAEMLGIADGEYNIEVELRGGSGRASVTSPTKIVIKNGEITAEVQFSSDNYDYAIVNDERYEADTSSGKSLFTIPVKALDAELPITADTTAMSTPHEIDYTLYFKSETIE